jgi:hypothetical protein
LPGLGRTPGVDDLGFLGLGRRTGRKKIGFFFEGPGQKPEIGVILGFGGFVANFAG